MGGIHRAGTYPATIKTPKAPTEYSAIQVTFSQNQQVLVTKELGDEGLTLNGDAVEVVLTQQETLRFQPSAGSAMGAVKSPPAFLQIRCYASDLEAPASACWPIAVYDSLTSNVLAAPEVP